ncbi:hypothetical protein JOQ06_027039 [Pogonophryne albipinna]|uniref:ATP-citrate synthase n=1 Tax=Pogonophryne albipinna TaxID=1090488 RepID=A0AAD6BDG4_9TELE|nr:hypothetical protein JOQ06_027039 [Pogonophryne albipinna]
MAAVDIDVPVDTDLEIPNQDDLEREAEGFKEQGNAFYSKKDYSEAFNYYTKAIGASPKTASYYGNRAATLMMLFRIREALEDSQQAVRLDECFMKGHLREGKCHLLLGNAMAANRCFQKVLELEPSNREALQENKTASTLLEYERMAEFGFEKRDFRKVVYCMDRALVVATACHRFKILKAECLALLGRYPEAQSVASDILRMDSTNADALYVRGLCLYYEDCIDKAVQFFVQALRMAPDHEKARLACRNAKALKAKKDEGNLAFKSCSYDAAYKLYTEALTIDPNNIKTNAKLYCNRATAGVKLRKLNEAIEDCTSAIKLDDTYIKAYLRRAQCFMNTEQYEEAVRDYEKVYQTEKTSEHKHLLKTAQLELKKSKRKDYYKVLGVGKSATEDEIKKAYRKRALMHHPDRHSAATQEVQKEEEKKFKEVGEAFTVLSDPKKKMRYDSGHDLEDEGSCDGGGPVLSSATMSAKAISEQTGKEFLYKYICTSAAVQNRFRYANATAETDWVRLAQDHPWLLTERLVVKPDQLIKRRGKLGLVGINLDLQGVQEWLKTRMMKETTVGKAKGVLKNFLIEPFVPHPQEEEFYVCIYATREGDQVLFHHEGGVEVGDVDAKAERLMVAVNEKLILASFIVGLFNLYEDLYFTYLEINPIVVTKDGVYVLDMAAKIDATADYICKAKWGDVEFPPPFGREAYPEEAYIADLDAKSGASLKLTLLNPRGRIWTMVAGGGASVVYSDTICDLGGVEELANYGEYSGAPSEQQTYDYAKTILSLMTREKHPQGKVLIIGGSIANFTNVAATFKGIVRAIKDYQGPLKEHEVTIFVRRGGPNYQEGLRVMGEVGKTTGIPIHVFGTETHMTAIVGMALGHKPIPNQPPMDAHTANFLLNASNSAANVVIGDWKARATTLFRKQTKAIVWGMQTRAVQGMLDFDYVCSRDEPSVAAMVYPFTSGDHKQKFYWGHKEILTPVYKSMDDAMKKHPEVDVLISFASLRSAFDSTMEAMQHPQIHTIAIIAEGIPEAQTRKIIKMADEKGVTIIGPATVGGIKPGCFKIGNTGGMLDNILASKLYRPGSVAYVSRSGGMSNELNNIVSRTTDGIYEGVAIGGDRYPGSTFMGHVLRYQDTPGVKMIIMLGEIGGTEEYKICQGIREGRITKPVVCWCIGTCATMFTSEVQFGHAGACANQASETAVAKNQALRDAGAYVPKSFDELGDVVKTVYDELVANGTIIPAQEVPPPTVPMDYSWARELGLIRKPASFMTSICDERGQELIYAGMPITEIFKEEMGLGGVLGLLWFQRRLPRYACKFIEMCLMVTADHGPAVSGAHNTIVCARAGKDLISSLTSGLLTIGDRFGGALDAAAKQFSKAFDSGMVPMEFVNKMKKDGKLIMGIGHRVKSINNPDMRVQILKDYVKQNFPSSVMLDYALDVEKITTSKKPNLILNVDGFIGVAFVDLLRTCGGFTRDEADEFVEIGALNGIFVLGRSMGFIGHYLDQKRLKQGLYRHPWDDISYVLPEHMSM